MVEKIDVELFKMDAAGCCGVLIRKDLMKKVCKLQSEYNQRLKELLNENTENMYSYDWAMAYDKERGGEAFYSNYLSKYCSVENRVPLFKVVQPIKAECYNTTDRDAVLEILLNEYEAQFKQD
jgi:hypothetical protein